MTENDNQPPVPSKQTSSVPLKKETVRVTLKAADAPPAVPSATVPMAPPVRPPVPGAPPTPTAPAPTIALRPAGKAGVSPAPTIRLATSTAPTSALRPPAGSTPTLPKATVQLQAPTQALGAAFPPTSQVAMFKVEEEVEEEPYSLLVNILSGVGFAAAIAVLVLQLMISQIWINVEDNPKVGDWAQLIE
ncbi:MAG: hypothetical protein NTV46_08480 [Verrucomicrobia bacterium]|nr:hypothetical protein [Verrucomicrobiota bacterium]